MTNNNTSFGGMLVIQLQCGKVKPYKYTLYGWQKIVYTVIPVCLFVMWIPSVSFNLTALLVYLKKSMRKRLPNLFILHTILADLLTGLISIPLSMSHHILLVYNHQLLECLLFLAARFIGFILFDVSFLMVTFAAIDRYVAVFRPYFYSTRFSHLTKLYYSIIIFTWIFSASITSLYFSGVFLLPLVFVALELAINFYVNLKLWCTVRKIRRTIQGQMITMHDGTENIANNSYNRKNTHSSLALRNSTNMNNPSLQSNKSNARSNRVVLFILLSFCACHLPFFISFLLLTYGNETNELYTVEHIGYLVWCFSKSVLNPIIYWYSLPSVRRKMKTMLCCYKQKNSAGGKGSRKDR